MSTGSTGTTSSHYNFILPGYNDDTDVDDFNSNFTTIDTELYDAVQDIATNAAAIAKHSSDIAPVEVSPATAAHAVGSYLVYNGDLYKVTSAISVGNTLTVGTNISLTSLGSEIKTLQDSVGDFRFRWLTAAQSEQGYDGMQILVGSTPVVFIKGFTTQEL